jgi:hypothetical protein
MSRVFGKKNDPDHNDENRARARDYSRRYMEFLEETCPGTWERLAGYKGDSFTSERLRPDDKARLLNKKGWDLTPRAFLEYSRLNRAYRKIKNDYPVESTRWETDAVFDRLLRSLK